MKFIYCKINMGAMDQPIMLVDTDTPSLTQIGTSTITDLGKNLVAHCYAANEYKVKLEGNAEFYKAIIGNVNTYDKDKQIQFI